MSRRNSQAKSADTDISSPIMDFLSLRLREGLVILLIAVALFLFLALLTYHHTDPGWSHNIIVKKVANAGGFAGAWIADFLLFFFGIWSFIFPFLLIYSAWLIYQNRFDEPQSLIVRFILVSFRVIGFLLFSLAGTGLISAYYPTLGSRLPNFASGVLGQMVMKNLIAMFNFYGCILILSSLFLIGVTLLTGWSWLGFVKQIGYFLFKMLKELKKVNFKIFKWPQFRLRKLNLTPIALKSAPKSSKNIRVEPDCFNIISKEGRDNINLDLKRAQPKIIPIVTKSNSEKASIKIQVEQESSKNFVPYSSGKNSNSQLPNLELLSPKDITQEVNMTTEELEQRSRDVESRLADFGISVQVVAVYPGPVVTRFEVQLAAGTKVSKISTLAKDLARSLSVVSVRVVEVIPGKSVIGIELPNQYREMVTLQEVIDSKAYVNSRSAVSLALGKDIAGNAVVVDLAKMPHLLVAGTTGAGKSVSLNVMLLSLLYKATPEQLRLIMIDPKMLELAVYDGIPHLLTPVVTDMKDAASALRWCVVEMERRYRLMASLGVRNIMGFNLKIKEALAKGTPLLDPLRTIDNDADRELQELPIIVVLADEFADMMVVVGKKVETLIARLAQKARAAGIHLILATQRPSVDVITGLIKANIPTRIAFQVSSKIDSRTILDQQGAEQLLGNGDMLYLAPGTGVPVRVHGAYVSDEDVHRVVSYLKLQGEPQYLDNLLDENNGVDSSGYTESLVSDDSLENDPFYDEAVHMVTKTRRVSVSSIQRRFKIGYNRAARIVESMETAGVVSKMESNGGREVLAPPPHD